MLRPGLHFSNAGPITVADLDVIRRWSPVSLLEAIDIYSLAEVSKLYHAWEIGGYPEVVLRRYFEPRQGNREIWGAHALEWVHMARGVIAAGIPATKILAKPFNEPNMPWWAQYEGFGDRPEDMDRYNEAILIFVNIVKNELPEVRVGGPHLTIGNRDVKFPTDPPGVYYYHGADMLLTSSPCYQALLAFDVHFVHCYAFDAGQYKERAYGLRFTEYEKYLKRKPVYIVESGCAINSPYPWHENRQRGHDTAAYLKLLGDHYPEVKGVAFFIGGDRGWDAFRHSDGWDPESHRPVVTMVEEALRSEPQPETPPDPDGEEYKLAKGIANAGIRDMVDLRAQIETFSDLPRLALERRVFGEIRYLVLHHSASEKYTDPIAIAKWHIQQKPGAKDPTIPYHFLIGRDGRLYFTAKLIWTTYHSGREKYNLRGIAIGILDDLSQRRPSPEALDTLRRLLYALNEFFGGGWGKYRGLWIIPHGEIVDTECPAMLYEDLVWGGDWPAPPFFSTYKIGA